MKGRKISSLLAVFVVAVTFVVTTYFDIKTSVLSEQTSETVEMETIEPPEEGWTLEELMDVTYIYGHKVKYPCTTNTFGEGFNFNWSPLNVNEEDNLLWLEISYKLNVIGYATIEGNSQTKLSDDSKICSLVFSQSYSDKENHSIIINGITFGSIREEVIEQLGVPDISEEKYIEYLKPSTDERIIALGFNDGNTLSSVRIMYR